MIRTLAFSAAFALAFAGAGHAAPPEKGEEGGETRENVRVSSFKLPNDYDDEAEAIAEAFAPPEEGSYVDLPSMNVPVVAGDRLMGYAFVMVRFHLKDGADDWDVRDEAHILLDAGVRIAHRVPFGYAGPESFTSEATRAALAEGFDGLLEGAPIERIELLGGDMRLLTR